MCACAHILSIFGEDQERYSTPRLGRNVYKGYISEAWCLSVCFCMCVCVYVCMRISMITPVMVSQEDRLAWPEDCQYACVCMYVCMYVCCQYVCLCMLVGMLVYVCMYVCMYACNYACVCM